jgi:hypothetical protein
MFSNVALKKPTAGYHFIVYDLVPQDPVQARRLVLLASLLLKVCNREHPEGFPAMGTQKRVLKDPPVADIGG